MAQNPNEIRIRGRVRMMEHRNLARKPRRGFSANTFPIAEGRVPAWRTPWHPFDHAEGCSSGTTSKHSLSISLFPFPVYLVRRKSSLELPYHGEHLDARVASRR